MARRIWTVIICGLMMSVCQAAGAPPKQLTLFGVPIKGAARAQFRQVLKAHGMVPTRENDDYWYDGYDPSSVLDGASKFAVGYVSAPGRFAMAEYTFPGTMDTRLVAKVIAMVQSKYGPPSSMDGDIAVGAVKAIWNFPNGMEILVSRDWPDTTTYLDYIDLAARKAMETEIAAEKRRQAQQSANRQDSAY